MIGLLFFFFPTHNLVCTSPNKTHDHELLLYNLCSAPIFNMAPRMHHSHQHLEHLSEEDDNDAVTTVDAAKGVGNEEKVTEPMNKISTNNDEDNDVNVEGEVDALAKGLEKQNIN